MRGTANPDRDPIWSYRPSRGDVEAEGPLASELWLRFQISYLSGFPCIMGIALLYAHYIGFEAFDPS
jgi:hypothetical protein